jgi:hypothetical protein
MQEIGNFEGEDPLRTDEEMTHWGLWCIISGRNRIASQPMAASAWVYVCMTCHTVWLSNQLRNVSVLNCPAICVLL